MDFIAKLFRSIYAVMLTIIAFFWKERAAGSSKASLIDDEDTVWCPLRELDIIRGEEVTIAPHAEPEFNPVPTVGSEVLGPFLTPQQRLMLPDVQARVLKRIPITTKALVQHGKSLCATTGTVEQRQAVVGRAQRFVNLAERQYKLCLELDGKFSCKGIKSLQREIGRFADQIAREVQAQMRAEAETKRLADLEAAQAEQARRKQADKLEAQAKAAAAKAQIESEAQAIRAQFSVACLTVASAYVERNLAKAEAALAEVRTFRKRANKLVNGTCTSTELQAAIDDVENLKKELAAEAAAQAQAEAAAEAKQIRSDELLTWFYTFHKNVIENHSKGHRCGVCLGQAQIVATELASLQPCLTTRLEKMYGELRAFLKNGLDSFGLQLCDDVVGPDQSRDETGQKYGHRFVFRNTNVKVEAIKDKNGRVVEATIKAGQRVIEKIDLTTGEIVNLQAVEAAMRDACQVHDINRRFIQYSNYEAEKRQRKAKQARTAQPTQVGTQQRSLSSSAA